MPLLQHLVLQELLRGTPPDAKHPTTGRTPLGAIGATLARPLALNGSTSPRSGAFSPAVAPAGATDAAPLPPRGAEPTPGAFRWATRAWAAASGLTGGNGDRGERGLRAHDGSEVAQRAAATTAAALRVARLLLAFGADPNQG
jgi:hypothetical protein